MARIAFFLLLFGIAPSAVWAATRAEAAASGAEDVSESPDMFDVARDAAAAFFADEGFNAYVDKLWNADIRLKPRNLLHEIARRRGISLDADTAAKLDERALASFRRRLQPAIVAILLLNASVDDNERLGSCLRRQALVQAGWGVEVTAQFKRLFETDSERLQLLLQIWAVEIVLELAEELR